jgi:hypothetical protein
MPTGIDRKIREPSSLPVPDSTKHPAVKLRILTNYRFELTAQLVADKPGGWWSSDSEPPETTRKNWELDYQPAKLSYTFPPSGFTRLFPDSASPSTRSAAALQSSRLLEQGSGSEPLTARWLKRTRSARTGAKTSPSGRTSPRR